MGFYQDERWLRLLATQAPALNTPAPALLTTGFRPQGFSSPREYENQWKATLQAIGQNLEAQALSLAQALVREYYESYRGLRNAIGRILKADLIEQSAVELMFSSVSAVKDKVDAAKSMAQLKLARESFLESQGCINEYLAERKLVEYEQLLEDQKRKDDLAKANSTVQGYRLGAHTRVRELALKTAPIFTKEGQAICHMVSVAVDLESGKMAEGRAGHQMGKDELEKALGFGLPSYAASAFSTQNPYNCAELEALYVLKKLVPTVKMKSVYFAAMMPGGSPIIPPCANCRRWITAQGAGAAKMS